MKALVVKKEWLDLILDGDKSGKKDWEIRGSNTRVRGRIGLIESGSGLVVGEAELTDSFKVGLYTLEENKKRHRIEVIEAEKMYDDPHVWVLRNSKRYEKPIPYKHPQGAVIWVNLPDELLKDEAPVWMVDYGGMGYVPADLCTIDRGNEPDDFVGCGKCFECDEGADCGTCIVSRVFNDYARLTGQTGR